jgi:hypothetical protein
MTTEQLLMAELALLFELLGHRSMAITELRITDPAGNTLIIR